MDEPRAPQLVKTLIQLVVRHDQACEGWINSYFFESRAQGRTLHPAPGEKSGESRGNRDSTTLMPLRQHLIIALLRSLQQRVGQIVEAKETDSLYVTSVEKGLILADRSFPFHKWDASTQKLAIDKKTAVSSKKKH